MKRIVIFTQNLDIGGVQKSVFYLAHYLKKNFDLIVVLAEDNKKIKYEFNDINVLKIKTKLIDTEKPNIGDEIFAYRVSELNKILNQLQPDILISYEDYNNLIALSTKYKCKKIISCRVSIQDSYKNKNIHLLDEEFYHKHIKQYYPLADKIICVGKHIENELINNFHLSNTITIHNGIEKYQNNIEDINYDNFILNIGRLHTQKGQKDLILAFDMIKDNISQDLLIVGDGAEKKDLQNLINDLNLTGRVFLIGFDTPYKYIKRCELFVFPSYYEGFSNTVLEVMNMKKNIVSYNYKGSDEILFLENLVECGDIKKLSLKILSNLKNTNTNHLQAKKLYERSKNFTLNNTLRKYKREIDLLCAE